MVSLRALQGLVAIVEWGSLTRAAAKLHMSQPALSHQIAALERELGTPVIERLPRGIRPTAAGLAAAALVPDLKRRGPPDSRVPHLTQAGARPGTSSSRGETGGPLATRPGGSVPSMTSPTAASR